MSAGRPSAPGVATAVSFTATVRIQGINPYVPVPKRVSDHFGRRGPVQVRAMFQGKEFPRTLMPVGKGRHILHVHGPMMRHGGLAVGDRITVALAADPRSRMPAMHPALAAALDASPRAKAAFAALRPSRRKDVLRYLHNLKSEAAVARNVARFVAGLETADLDLPMGM
jgi:hypothetical protein